jgi:AraC family transcriptional activator of pobA
MHDKASSTAARAAGSGPTPTAARAGGSRSRAAAIPAYALYGEAGAPGGDLLHVEPVQSRSARYDGEIDVHVHRGLHQLIWLATGPVQLALDDLRQTAQGPLAIVVPAGVVHAFRFARDSDGHVLTISPRLLVEGDVPALGAALDSLFARARVLPLPADDPATSRLAALFELLDAEFGAPGGIVAPLPLWLARCAVWRLAQAAQEQPGTAGASGTSTALFTRFVVLVEAHYRDHWPVSRFAAQLGLSTERLNRLTRGATSRTALDLIHDRLLREACRRIVYVAAPISSLAFDLGFDDPAYFCRFFKRRIGSSPKAYRAAVLARGA